MPITSVAAGMVESQKHMRHLNRESGLILKVNKQKAGGRTQALFHHIHHLTIPQYLLQEFQQQGHPSDQGM